MTLSSRPTKMQRLCDAAEIVLRSRGREMHYTELADSVFSNLGMPREPAARLNTVLHDDGSGRFRRTGRGTWQLAAPPTKPAGHGRGH
jgi:DNA-directed RNA polymerase delta subunit